MILEHPILALSIEMGADITAGLFVDGDGTLPAANTRPLGVLYMDTKDGELGTLRVLGIVPAVIGAAVAAGRGSAGHRRGQGHHADRL